MSYPPGPTPPVEVRVYRYGRLKVCEWCASVDDAQQVADMWNKQRATRCEIDGLSA